MRSRAYVSHGCKATQPKHGHDGRTGATFVESESTTPRRFHRDDPHRHEPRRYDPGDRSAAAGAGRVRWQARLSRTLGSLVKLPAERY